MKKNRKFFISLFVLAVLSLAVTACAQKVSIPCGDGAVQVKLQDAIEAHDVCVKIGSDQLSATEAPVAKDVEDSEPVAAATEAAVSAEVQNQQNCMVLPIRSADVTDNFAGYVEYQAKNWTVPSCTVQDGIVSNVGSALITWCEYQNTCTWWVAQVGEPIPHEGEVNLYVPGFETHKDELQYVNPDATWTEAN